MTRPRVFVTRTLPDAGLKQLQALADTCDIDLWTDPLPPPHELLAQKVAGLSGLLCLLTDRIDAALMDAAGSSLKVISQLAVGFDNIDIPAATARRIPVGHTPGVLTDATADFTWALLMAAARRVVEGDRFTRAGRWQTWDPIGFLGPDLAGATLGIIGFGRIGQAVARRAQGFDLRILYHDPQRHLEAEQTGRVQYADLAVLLRDSDFVTLHTTLSAATYHYFDDDKFRQMKPGAILINTSRGPIVDPAALYRALSTRAIAAAAIDVTEPEPIDLNDPLLTLDNLIVTPHIASASFNSRNRMAAMAVANLAAGLNGQRLPHCVNPEVYD